MLEERIQVINEMIVYLSVSYLQRYYIYLYMRIWANLDKNNNCYNYATQISYNHAN